MRKVKGVITYNKSNPEKLLCVPFTRGDQVASMDLAKRI
jgi:hypothetical protein